MWHLCYDLDRTFWTLCSVRQNHFHLRISDLCSQRFLVDDESFQHSEHTFLSIKTHLSLVLYFCCCKMSSKFFRSLTPKCFVPKALKFYGWDMGMWQKAQKPSIICWANWATIFIKARWTRYRCKHFNI